ncbi:N-acetylmuramoyl-L-alanine amidase [Streptomyces roseirectus]|uniref:N-acetylmuramoyl-L-alanine amidase n=1 Tax=Streptomyces roseirectus TaxID=2768066 RepID=A0A7H0I6U5_9ACTN|nr:peptidoglycan recognition family protein [Streptomyces roseirectus]QNP68511.1 N-acetylmuramoyl-L-alanine amidase [Streptomyces roseirectus]
MPRRIPQAVASAVLLLPLVAAAPPAGSGSARLALERSFASASAEYGVPRSVLLGVSYLQSRWDDHAGAPSVIGGYGPMHLTDARTALTSASHHGDGAEDPRGDTARPPLRPEAHLPRAVDAPRLSTLVRAAELTGLSPEALRSDPAANVAGGAALLAAAQRALGEPLSANPADWYGAVARFSGADDTATAAAYADDVYEVLRTGAERTTDAGQFVALAGQPQLVADKGSLAHAGLRRPVRAGTECPKEVSCEWIPAPYEEFGEGDYGNHDLAGRPVSQPVRYLVVHDTEGAWEGVLNMVQDPTYVSWHYTLRSSDGHIAQHVKTKDVAWHAGNWYVNAGSVGIEHEGFLASPDTWYTEAMYRTSARLVRYLADRYRIPLDRQHILGHDNVPGPTATTVAGMHTDPGPYWDWRHYFELLKAPVKATAGAHGGLVTIRPSYAANRPAYTDCVAKGRPCADHGSSEVRLFTGPGETYPLVKDVGRGTAPTIGVNDISSRVSTGQQYAVAERRGEWTAIWYLGQKAWFKNPRKHATAVHASGLVVRAKAGRDAVPVYGRAYPEASAYPKGVPVQAVVPLAYTLPAGQAYVVGGKVPGEYYYAVTFATGSHRVVTGKDMYYEIQYGHRVAFVRATDVDVVPSVRG